MLIHIFPERIQLERSKLRIPLKRGEETSLELAIKNHGPPVHFKIEIPQIHRDKIILAQSGMYIRSEELIPISIRLPRSGKPGFKAKLRMLTSSGLSSMLQLEVGEGIPWRIPWGFGIKLESRACGALGALGFAGILMQISRILDSPGLMLAGSVLISMVLMLGVGVWFKRVFKRDDLSHGS